MAVATKIPGIAGPGAKYPQYAVVVDGNGNPTTGVVESVGNSVEKELLYSTAFPNTVYLFTSRQAAVNYVNSQGGSPNIPGIYNPQTGSGVLGAGANALNTATGAISDPLNYLYSIADAFHRLTEPQTWVRIGEFAVGGMLVYVGIRASTQGTAVGEAAKSATRPAKKAVSIATSITPTGRAVRTITKHEARVKASRTRQRAAVIRGKQKEFGRRELYR